MSTQTTLRSKLPGLPSVSDLAATAAGLIWAAIYTGGVLLQGAVAYQVAGIPGLVVVGVAVSFALLRLFPEWRSTYGLLATISTAAGPIVMGLGIFENDPTLLAIGFVGGVVGFVLFDELNERFGNKPAAGSTEVTT